MFNRLEIRHKNGANQAGILAVRTEKGAVQNLFLTKTFLFKLKWVRIQNKKIDFSPIYERDRALGNYANPAGLE